jgi:hypothetical protein
MAEYVYDQTFAEERERLVAEHLGPEVIERMIPALKPGGVLLLEDYDFSSATVHPRTSSSSG